VNQRGDLRALAIWLLVVFIYAIIAMAVAREILIPYMFTSSLNGNIEGDPQYYNLLALKKAAEIKAQGLMAFELRPAGQGPAGIASLGYLLGVSPYYIVLLNSLLHALSTVLMALILRSWFSLRISIIASLPLAISPYTIFWFSQPNKDSFVLAGTLFFTYGLLKLAGTEWKLLSRNGMLLSLLSIATGILLIWIMRPYVNQILLPISGLILVSILLARVRRGVDSHGCFGFAMCGALVLACLGLLGNGGSSGETLESFDHFQWSKQAEKQAEKQAIAAKCFANVDERNWHDERFLPDIVNKKLKSLMGQRCLIFTILETQDNVTTRYSIIDTDRLPSGSAEALAYLPRAALLGVFSPWIDRWGYAFGQKPSAFYVISPIEAAILYVGLVSLCVWLFLSRSWIALIPIAICVFVMTIYGAATPFLGALYRYRYPWWMLLICLGAAALLDMLGCKTRGKQ